MISQLRSDSRSRRLCEPPQPAPPRRLRGSRAADQNDSASAAKRHKGSDQSAAAAVGSTSDGADHGQAATGALPAAAAAPPLTDPPSCSVCLDLFGSSEAKDGDIRHSRLPPTLPCSHSVCSGCLFELLRRSAGSDARSSPRRSAPSHLHSLDFPSAHSTCCWMCLMSLLRLG